MSSFHAREGWFFERREDGSVQVQRRLPIETFAGIQSGWPVEHVVFDADTWASIVASVSAKGEDAQTFGWAQTLHAGGRLIRAAYTPGPDPMPGGPLPDPFDGGDAGQDRRTDRGR